MFRIDRQRTQSGYVDALSIPPFEEWEAIEVAISEAPAIVQPWTRFQKGDRGKWGDEIRVDPSQLSLQTGGVRFRSDPTALIPARISAVAWAPDEPKIIGLTPLEARSSQSGPVLSQGTIAVFGPVTLGPFIVDHFSSLYLFLHKSSGADFRVNVSYLPIDATFAAQVSQTFYISGSGGNVTLPLLGDRINSITFTSGDVVGGSVIDYYIAGSNREPSLRPISWSGTLLETFGMTLGSGSVTFTPGGPYAGTAQADFMWFGAGGGPAVINFFAVDHTGAVVQEVLSEAAPSKDAWNSYAVPLSTRINRFQIQNNGVGDISIHLRVIGDAP